MKRKHLIGAVSMLSFIALAVTSSKLLLQNFPSKEYFTFTYFAYTVAGLTFVHSIFFFANMELKEITGRGLSKNVPRYIDYCVTALIAIGLVQIYFSEDVFGRYIGQLSGTKLEIATNIKRKAAEHLKEDCTEREGVVVELCKKLGLEDCTKNAGFPVAFCKKLDGIVSSKDLDEYISKTLSKDFGFLNHAIGYVATQGGPVPMNSPITNYVNQYIALSEYGVVPQDPERKFVWSWLALVLLPLILSFRATKTSLELYGDLS